MRTIIGILAVELRTENDIQEKHLDGRIYHTTGSFAVLLLLETASTSISLRAKSLESYEHVTPNRSFPDYLAHLNPRRKHRRGLSSISKPPRIESEHYKSTSIHRLDKNVYHQRNLDEDCPNRTATAIISQHQCRWKHTLHLRRRAEAKRAER